MRRYTQSKIDAGATCSVADCGRGVVARGYCQMHWRRWRKHGDPSIVIPQKGRTSERKRLAAIANAKLATAANKAKPSTAVEKPCLGCGVTVRCKRSHQNKVSYCSKECMGRHYRSRMTGSNNPNFRDLKGTACETCGTVFATYDRRRKFCSHDCYVLSGTSVAGRGSGSCNIDRNQPEIVEALLTVGASVLLTSAMGGGVPDLIVGYRGRNFLIEIKNPETDYGRKGLSKAQQIWAEHWPIEVVRTVEEAFAAIGATRDCGPVKRGTVFA